MGHDVVNPAVKIMAVEVAVYRAVEIVTLGAPRLLAVVEKLVEQAYREEVVGVDIKVVAEPQFVTEARFY